MVSESISASLEKFFYIIVSCLSVVFCFWVLFISPFYGDDLWYLGNLRGFTWLDFWTVPVFGDSNHIPIFHLWMWLIVALPMDFPWVHMIQGVLLIGTCGLFHLYLYQIKIASWIRWLITALFLTTPTIAESIFWTAATHLWLGGIWALLALILLPRDFENTYFYRWIGTFACVLLCMMTTELMYGFCVFFMAVIGFKYRYRYGVVLGCLVTVLLMVAIVAQRNYLINGDWAQLSLERHVYHSFLPQNINSPLHQILVYSNPLSLLDKASKGYLVFEKWSHSRLFYQLLWQTAVWFVVLQRVGRNGWDLLLLAFSTPLMIILGGGPIFERYLFVTIMGNILGLALFIDELSQKSSNLRKLLGGAAIIVILINGTAFFRITTDKWAKDGLRYRAFIELIEQESPERGNPIGLVDSLSLNPRPLRSSEWWHMPNNSLMEWQTILSEMRYPLCVYDLLKENRFEGGMYPFAHVTSVNRLQDECGPLPNEVKCFQYQQTGRFSGKFMPYKGDVTFSQLPEQAAIHPIERPVTCI